MQKQELAKITNALSSKNYSPEAVQRSCRNIDAPSEAFKSGMPTLASMYREFGEKKVLAYIKLWITDLVEFLNVGKTMTGGQINQTAQMIYDEYHYLNIADINLIFKRGKMGYYGQPFKLDGQVILNWFREYNNERCLAAVDENTSKGLPDKEYEPVPKHRIEMIDRIVKELTDRK